jgi:Toprim-like
MEDNQFLEQVHTVIDAAQSFVDTDAAYGPNDPRTQMKKERLAHVMGTLAPTNVEVPRLQVVRDDPARTLPVSDPQRWNQVRAYLTEGCELPGEWITALHEQGKIYADLHGEPVFVPESSRDGESRFTVRLASEDHRIPPVLIIAERPVDALSVLEVHRRLYRDRVDGNNERESVTVIATEGVHGLPHRAIEETLSRGGVVRVATNNSPAGELIWHQVRNQYPLGQVTRARPSMKDWNEDLRFHNACYRDPTVADRMLREVHQANAPDARAREATREAVHRLAPARTRDDWGRDR